MGVDGKDLVLANTEKKKNDNKYVHHNHNNAGE